MNLKSEFYLMIEIGGSINEIRVILTSDLRTFVKKN